MYMLTRPQIARAQQRRILDILQSVSTYSPAVAANSANSSHHNRTFKALKMNVIIAGAFYVAWIPYSVVQVVLSFAGGVDIPQWLIFSIQWIAFANSFWNSIIYYYWNLVYRDKALLLYRSLFCYFKEKVNLNGPSRDRSNQISHTNATA